MSGSSTPTIDTGAPSRNCADFELRTHLASPVKAVIAELRAGDILSIQLMSATGPLQALTNDGAVAGAILTSNPAMLITCISQDYGYSARILNIVGGDCQVAIFCSKQP